MPLSIANNLGFFNTKHSEAWQRSEITTDFGLRLMNLFIIYFPDYYQKLPTNITYSSQVSSEASPFNSGLLKLSIVWPFIR